jgi:mono/diheme cytochrome c family protein
LRTDTAFAAACLDKAVLRRALTLAAVVALALGTAGCEFRIKMYDQAKYEPYEKSELFADGTSARPYPAGTVARGHLGAAHPYYTGTLADGEFVPAIPLPPADGGTPAAMAEPAQGAESGAAAAAAWQPRTITAEYLARGRERFDVFCSPCHGRLGDGNGMIVQRGYKRPASYHQARLRNIADGYFFDVVTRGFGQMPSYASQVPVADRWAIVAYVRALQLSQNARLAELPADLQQVADRALAAADDGTAQEPETADSDTAHHNTDGE